MTRQLFYPMIIILLAACATSRSPKEKCLLLKSEDENGLSFKKLKNQEQLLNREGVGRGLVDGYLISLATDGIKSLIDNRKKKFTAQYSMAIGDLHFYNNLSSNGAFDPTGIIFNGFTLVRLAARKNQATLDTALIAHFVLDTVNSYEIANNSMFRLKLDSLDYRFTKAKFRKAKKTMDIDFEITFTTSYVNEEGNFFTNVELGKFYYAVRNAPVGSRDSTQHSFYLSLRNTALTGASFIVPRSYGHYVSTHNELKPSYSWGNYSISAKVKESSRQTFVDKIIIANSDQIISSTKSQLQKTSKKMLGN